MERRPARARRHRRTLSAIALVALAALSIGMVALRLAPPARTSERIAERETGDDPDRLFAPSSVSAPTIGPPLYTSKNTDGQEGSGSRAVVYRSGGRAITDAAITDQAPDPRLFRTGYGAWEPTLGLTKDGTVFFDARNSNADPGVIRSKDSGLTWQNVNPDAHKVSLDPYLWVDTTTGRIFDSDIDPTVTCPPLSYSDDQGKTWKTGVSCGVADHQSVFGGPPPSGGERPAGYPHVVYYCAISGGALSGSSTVTGCSKSLDGGDSFNPSGDPAFPVKVTGDPAQPNCDGGAGHGIVDEKGIVYVPRVWCGPPSVAISHDEGATWRQVTVADKPRLGYNQADGAYPHESGIAADRAGNLYYTWVADDRHPYLSISRDRGETWSTPRDVMPPGVDRMSAVTASVDAGDPGKVAAVFMGTADPASVAADKTRWNAYVLTSADALAADPVFYGATMNDPRTNALWIGTCGDLRCGNIGDFLDVAIGPDGTAWAALVDSCPDGDQCTSFGVTNPRGEAVAGQLVGGAPLVGTIADQRPSVVLPATATACRSRRSFRIRLREPRRGRLASARVYVNGRRARILRGKSLRAPVNLRGLPKGRYTVRVVATTTTGRTLVRTRHYRTCTPKA